MNLWVRTLGQLAMLAVALFFFSCEDETSFLGFKNPNKKFQVGYVEIPLNTSRVLTIDTLITDLRPVSENGQTQAIDGILVGEYQDPEFGKITTQSFLTVYPSANTALQTSAKFDSITVQFRLNFYAYGFTGLKEQRFSVHEITGDTLTLFNGNRYYANSPAPQYSPDAIGEASIEVIYDSLLKQASLTSGLDTLLATGRLSDDFGLRVFEALKPGFSTAADLQLFKSKIKGLALVPGQEPGIVALNVINNFGQLSRLTVHYHTLTDGGAVEDTLSRNLSFDYASFTKIDADRAGTELAAVQPYESIEPLSGLRYIQGGSPVITKLDLSGFYAFADTIDNILINSAELVIEDVPAPPGLEPHATLMFRLMNNNSDQFLNNRIAADREMSSSYLVLTSASEYYYFAGADASVPATISYNDEDDMFSGFMTFFTQSLLMNRNDDEGINENRLKYLALYPAHPQVGHSVTRTLFSKDNVKLKIFYTRANPLTP